MSNDISVSVGTNNSPLNAGLAAAKRSVDAFKEHTEESFKELGGELAGALAIGAVIEGIHSLLEEFSHIQDVSEKLGTSAESLQRMGAAAKLAGLDMEGLVKSMQKGTRNAVEALKGNEELASAFQDLGVDAAEFVNAKPEEQLIQLAEGYEKSGQNAATLNAILKTLGKSGADLIPLLKKGPESLREEMESASVASDDTVATLKESADSLERFWMGLKVIAATSLNWIISRVQDLGQYLAVTVAYVSNLGNGFKAAREAAEAAAQAAAEINQEKEQKRLDEEKKKKLVDTDALEGLKEAKREAEELQKLKDENAKKEHEAYLRSLDLLAKKAELEREILNIQLENENAKNDTERETNKSKILDIKKELEGTNKDIEKENERHAKEQFEKRKKATEQALKDSIAARKKALAESEKDLNSLEKAGDKKTSVDSLRQIGGGVAGANYQFGANKDDLIKQQVQHAKQSVEIQTKILAALEKREEQVASYDGGFN